MSQCLRYKFLFAVMLLVGCGRNESTMIPLSESWDMGSIPVVSNETGPVYDEPLFTLECDLVLGVDQVGPEWQMFGAPPYPLVGPDNSLYLTDYERMEIFYVSPSGSLLDRVGGRGAGPGEFEAFGDVIWAEFGVEFWVLDSRLQRVTRFSADAELLGTFRFSPQYNRGEGSWSFYDSSGTRKYLATGFPNQRSDDTKPIIVFGLLNEDLSLDKILTIAEGIPRIPTEFGMRVPVPFRYRPFCLFSMEDRILYADGNIGMLMVLSSDGEPLYRILPAHEVLPVTRHDKKAWKERIGGLVPDEVLESKTIPEHHPLFASAIIDDKNRIWLRRSRSRLHSSDEVLPDIKIDLFSIQGRWLGTEELSFFPYIVQGPYMYQVLSGVDDIPQLMRHRINWLKDLDGK